MKRSLVMLAVLPLLALAFSGVSQAWQGRMGGMGDPYGLISDESDFLIHPAKIATGEGVRFYGSYRFTHTGVTDWDYDLDRFDPTTDALIGHYYYNTSGSEQEHDVLLGASFPVGAGRMGLFFEYGGVQGNYDGDEFWWNGTTYYYPEYDLTNDLDDFIVRLLYGRSLGGFNLGGEAQLAYRQEENTTWLQNNQIFGHLNYTGGGENPHSNLSPFMFPADSEYWEALFKGSVAGEIGFAYLEFTLRGGFIFEGDNEYEYEVQVPVGTPQGAHRLDGSVEGWRVGGDLWVRYPLVDRWVLPFLVRIDYRDTGRDGDGPGSLAYAGRDFFDENRERSFEVMAGGGADVELTKGTRVAAGFYYNYRDIAEDFQMVYITPTSWGAFDFNGYPSSDEHRFMLRLAAEHKIFPSVIVRMGMNCFYGWIAEDLEFSQSNSTLPAGNYTDDISLDGSHWGVRVSLGSTLTLQRFTVEPCITVGYREYDLDGDGERIQITGVLSDLWDMDKDRSEWYVGGGMSVLFDL